MLICVQLNPTIDRVLEVPNFVVGDTLRIENVTMFPLGKAISVALAAKTIGETPFVVSPIGEHDVNLYDGFLTEKGISHKLIPCAGRTRSNMTIIDPIAHTTTHLRERGFTPTPDKLELLEKYLGSQIKKEDVVLFSGSLPPGLPEDTYARLLSHLPACKARGLDTSGPAMQEGIKGLPSFIKPNLEELAELFRETLKNVNISTLMPYIERFRKQGITLGAITLGDKGSIMWDQTSNVVAKLVLEKERIVDTVGCGDSFFAGLAAGAFHGWNLEHTARVATAAAGANALTPGAGIFLESDFKGLLEKVKVQPFKAK